MTTLQQHLEPGETLQWHGQPSGAARAALGDDVHYLITDRRVRVVHAQGCEAFVAAALSRLELRQAADGTADVVWDLVPSFRQPTRHPGLTLRFRRLRRDDRIGFLGVADGPGVHQRLLQWLAEQHDAAAQAAEQDPWTRWRDPGTDLGIELPAAWSTRVGRLKEYRILGLRVQRPPKWLAAPGAAWNLLESTVPDTCAAVAVHIDPITLPASLAEVLDSRLAKVMGLRIVASDAAVRVGGFEGFSTTADLHGVLGGRVELGPISVSTAGFKDRLRLTQTWLRKPDEPGSGTGRCVHLQCVTPSDADNLRQTLGRVLSSLRPGD